MSTIASATAVSGDSQSTTQIRKTGNVSLFSNASKGLTTIDTMGRTFEVPDYTIKDILSAIPDHCYKRLAIRSLGYVVRDITAMCVIFWAGNTYIPQVQLANEVAGQWVRGALWMTMSYLMGLFGFGLWILAHECGHLAFSDYQLLNDTVGWVLHLYLMVPYFSWQYSHKQHHAATGHMTRDMVFVPYTKEEYLINNNVTKASELLEELPIWSLMVLIFQQLGGLQFHLATNATGQPYNVPWYAKLHYAPKLPIFTPNQYWYIVLSDIGILSTILVVYTWYKNFGMFSMVVGWFVPWLWVNHWLVFVTFLQHTDLTMPHYDAKEWTFARGAAATIDRNFGFVGQHIFHDIIETHVLHHYVSRIPFYNAREASAAIRKVMGKHYRYEGENMWISLWKTIRMCQFVEEDKDAKGVYMFRNANNIGVKARDD